MHDSLEDLARSLRAGVPVPDHAFDASLTTQHRGLSGRFWTSVGVVLRTSRWLEAGGATRVVDVGAGIGKFCIVGALSSTLSFVGIEHREHLVEAARDLAERFGVADRATFVLGEFGRVPLPVCNALYFFNPFGEQPFPRGDHIDKTVQIGRQRLSRDVAAAEKMLELASVGMLVVTYNAFGGRLPDTFDLVRAQDTGLAQLRLWRKARTESHGGWWLELYGATILCGADASDIRLVVQPCPRDAPP